MLGLASSVTVPGWPRIPKPLRLVGGLLALWVAWLAVVQARMIGINFLLSVFCLVWMADIAAYFCGKAFGRRKLAPTISPGKSWEGVYGGMAGVLLLGRIAGSYELDVVLASAKKVQAHALYLPALVLVLLGILVD